MKKNESKYFYSSELMNQALLELLEKKDVEFITVTEIAKKAGVNRSTFYLHYENVYELLEETVGSLNKEFICAFEGRTTFEINGKQNAFFITDKYLAPYLHFCKENKTALKLVHNKPQIFNKDKVYKRIYDKILYPAISQFISSENEKIYSIEYYTQGVVAIINKWLALDCVTEIDELIKIIKKCVGHCEE